MKICLFGNKETTTALLKHLCDADIAVDTVVTLGQAGRSKAKIAGVDDTLAAVAEAAGTRVYLAEKYTLTSDPDVAFFAEQRFDIGLCTGWQRLIPTSILHWFELGVFGWHGSGFRFPNGRGRSPLNWSIRLGCLEVYHNCFRYAPGADDGQVYDTRSLPIAPSDHIADLQQKALAHIKSSAVQLLTHAGRGPIPLNPQPEHPFVTFPALNETSGFLSPYRLTAQDAINITRSCSAPFPGAYVLLPEIEAKVRIWDLVPCPAADAPEALDIGQAMQLADRFFVRFRDMVVMSQGFAVLPADDRLPTGQRLPCADHDSHPTDQARG